MTGLEIVLNKYKDDKISKEEAIILINNLYKNVWTYSFPNIEPSTIDNIIYGVTCTQ